MLKSLGLLLVLAAAAAFFYPKAAGGPLCGPVCPVDAVPVKYAKSCLGFMRHEQFIDAYRDTCFGLVGAKICYGRAAAGDANAPLVKISCPAD